MANNNNQSSKAKPSRLSNSANYTIGGKKYNSHDVSRLRPQTKDVHTVSGTENAPRQVAKEVTNLSGAVHTSAGYEPTKSVHAQTESYKPSVNTQATVQTV